GHGELLLGVFLADHVVVEVCLDLGGLGELGECDLFGGGAFLLLHDLVAELDAFVADVDRGSCDETLHLLLRLAAEAAFQQLATLTESGHISSYLVGGYCRELAAGAIGRASSRESGYLRG